MISSIVGIKCRSLPISWLAERMSTQSLTPPGSLGLGTSTTGETQGVGPVAGSIMSFSSSDSMHFSRDFRW